MNFPKIEDIKMVKDLGGSTGAYLVKDSASNNLFVLKKGMHPKQAEEEYLANKIYSILNVDVPQTELYKTQNGDVFILHEYIPNVQVANEVLTDDLIKQISKDFVADSLLANWDAYQNDNILVNLDDGKAYRIDNGGAMRYRARGGVKNSFNGSVSELQSLRENNTNITQFIDSDEIKKQIIEVVKYQDEVLAFITDQELKEIMKSRFLFLKSLLGKEKIMKKGGDVDFNPDGAIKDKIINLSGNNGGMLVGKRHSESGIKAINLSTGQPIEMEGGEVVITRDAVSDDKKRSFNGKMLTNRQILSSINESGGGVSFADGGDIPENLSFNSNALFEYGGETMCGKDLACYMATGGVTTAIVTDPNQAMDDLQSTYGYGDVYRKGGKTKDDPCWDGYEQFGMKTKDGKEVPNCVPIMAKGGEIINNQNFKKWFGDSKVVDEEGNPLVVYHGTSNSFNVFDKKRIGENYIQSQHGGFFFAEKKQNAINYAYLHSGGVKSDSKGNVMSVFLKIKNPLIKNLSDEGYKLSPTDYYDDNRSELIREVDTYGFGIRPFVTDVIDGIIIKGENNDNLYVVFEPNQIKLADGSNITFDENNDDIRLFKGGAVDSSDEIDALIGQIDVLSFEDGGDIPDDENGVDTLSRIFGLPKSTGKGKNKIQLFKTKHISQSLIDATDNESILKIQFSTAKAQTFSDNVIAKFFSSDQDVLRDESVLSINIKYSIYNSSIIEGTTYSLQELIAFIENFIVESEGKNQDYATFYFTFNLSNGRTESFSHKGLVRKPTGRKKYSQFGIKDVKKDFNNFLEVLSYDMLSYQKHNMVAFVLGESQGAIDKANQDALDLAEKKKADAEATSIADEASRLATFTAEETKLFDNDNWGEVVSTIFFQKTGKRYRQSISALEQDQEDLKSLLEAFGGTEKSVQRAQILNELQKIKKRLEYLTVDFPTKYFLKSNDLLSAEGLLNYYKTQTVQSPTAPMGEPCNLPTPNGGKSKLPYSAYLNVRTPQFKSWFGDWEMAYETDNYNDCSKMINEETKEPRVFYHGVRKFSKVNAQGVANMGKGVVRPFGAFTPTDYPASFFSDNEEYAKFYGGIAKNQPKPSPTYKPFIYKLFLSIKNPLSLERLGFKASYKDLIDFLLVGYGVRVEVNNSLLERLNGDMDMINPLWVYIRNDIGMLETIKDYGYDALIQIGDIPVFLADGEMEQDREKHTQEKEFLTFYPNQVKSVTVKKSFYLDFFDDIRFKKGGYVRI